MQTYDFSAKIQLLHVVACGHSSQIVPATCLPAGRVGGLTRQVRQIKNSDASMESDNLEQAAQQVVGMAGLGVAVYWESGAEWRGGWWGAVGLDMGYGGGSMGGG